jgi:hypothetical protein
MNAWMGIDPGMSGGLAVLGDDGPLIVVKTPPTEGDLARLFETAIAPLGIASCLIEAVHSFPEQGVASAFTFGRGAGILIGLLLAHKIRFEEIQPTAWQKLLGIPPRVKLPKKPKPLLVYPAEESHTQWKNRLRAKAQQLFPGVEVTMAVADALLIAEACRRMHGEFREWRAAKQPVNSTRTFH